MSKKAEGVERFPVLVSAQERAEVALGVKLRKEALEKVKDGMEKQGVPTGAVDAILSVHAGNGTGGGLVTRFSTNENADLFPEAPAPKGNIRRLVDPEGDATPLDVLLRAEVPTGAEFFDPALIAKQLDTGSASLPDWTGKLVEDEEGRIFRVSLLTTLGWKFLGQRPSETVEEAVDASDEAAKFEKSKDAPIADVGDKKSSALRKVALLNIEKSTKLSVPHRERLAAYATHAAGLEWLRSWSTARARKPRAEVPEGWEPPAETSEAPAETNEATSGTEAPAGETKAPEAGTGDDVPPRELETEGTEAPAPLPPMTAAALALAQEKGVTAAELAPFSPSASGERYSLVDVQDAVAKRLRTVP